MTPKIPAGNLEIRTFSARELRVAPVEGGAGRLVGYAAEFNSLSEDMGGWFERIAPGAFAEAIARDDIRCLRDHEEYMILGRNKAGTLTLAEDDRGLAIDCAMPDVSYARDLAVSIERGDVNQMSFAFAVEDAADERWERIGDQVVRTLLKVKLYDVSAVTFPAYPSTSVGLRSFERFRSEQATPPAPTGRSTQLLARELDLITAGS